MTKRTHELGGLACALGGFLCMDVSGMLLPDVSKPLQICIILPYAIWSSTAPDLDQDKDSTAANSPINFAIQKFFKIIKAGHRDAKSHIYPMVISLVLYMCTLFGFLFGNLNGTEITIVSLLLLGLFLGFFSHFILDCMTESGLRINGLELRLVPESSLFSTGSMWETTVRKILYVISVVLIGLIIYL